MAKRVQVLNPRGIDTPPEYMVFPSYYPLEMIHDEVRERFPDKYWPEEEEETSSEELPSGFWGEFAHAYGDAFTQANEDLAMGVGILNSTDGQALNMLEEEYQKWKLAPDDRKQFPILSGGFLGETFGSVTRDIGVGISTGAAATMVSTPIGGIAVGGTTVATLQSLTAKGGSFRNTYFGERYKQDQEGYANLDEAFETSRKVSNIDSMSAAAEALGATLIPIPGFGKGLSKVGTKLTGEVVFDAALGATGSALSDSYAVSQGVERGDRLNNAVRAALQEVIGGSVPTAIRGATEWGKYTTTKRFLENRIAEEQARLEEIESNLANARKRVPITGERINRLPVDAQGRFIEHGEEVSYLARYLGLPGGEKGGASPPTSPTEPTIPPKGGTPKAKKMRKGGQKQTAPEVIEGEKAVKTTEGKIAKLENDLQQLEEGNRGFLHGSISFNWASVDFDNELSYGLEHMGPKLQQGRYGSELTISPINTEPPSDPVFVRPNTLYITIPLYNEEGVLHATRIATRKEVEALKEADKVPNTWAEDILQDPSVPFRSIVEIEGRYHELFEDGSVSKEALNSNWINPDGSVSSKNTGGQTTPNFQVPPPTSHSWLSFQNLTTETDKTRAGKLIQGLGAGKKYGDKKTGLYWPLLDPFTATNGVINWSAFLKEYGIEGVDIQDLPPRLDDFISVSAELIPPQLTRLLNNLSLGVAATASTPEIKGGEARKPNTAIGFNSTDRSTQTILIDSKEESIDRVENKILEIPVEDFGEGKEDIDGTQRVENQVGNADEAENLIRLIARRKLQIENESVVEDGVHIVPSPSREFLPLFKLLSNPQNKRIGPYAHWGDSSKVVKEDGGIVFINADTEYNALQDLEFKALMVLRKHHQFAVESLLKRGKELREFAVAKVREDADSAEAKKAVADLEELSAFSLRLGLHQKGMIDLQNVDYLKILQRGIGQFGVDVTPEIGIQDLIPLRNINPDGVFYNNTEDIPHVSDSPSLKNAIARGRKLNGDFAELETRLRNILKFRWYYKRFMLHQRDRETTSPQGFKIFDAITLTSKSLQKKLASGAYTKEEANTILQIAKMQQKLHNTQDAKTPGELYENVWKQLQNIETYIRGTDKFQSIQNQIDYELAGDFVDVSNLINGYLELAKRQGFSKSTGSVVTGKSDEAGFMQHIKNVVSGFAELGKLGPAMGMNMFFHPAALPKIYNALVGLAKYMAKRGITNVADFAKAIGSAVTDVVKYAWEDGVKGVYRGFYTLPPKVMKSMLNMVIPSRTTIEKMTPSNMLEMFDSWWESFVDKYSLQQYVNKTSDKLPAVKALIKQNFIDRYYALADIMARVGTGLSGKSMDERLAQLDDSINAYYKLDGLETLLGEKMSDFNGFRQSFQDDISENNVDLDEFEQFLYAKHAPSRNARIAEINHSFQDYHEVDEKSGSGMSNMTAEKTLADIQAKGKTQLYQNLADKYVYSLTARTLDVQFESGLINRETYDRLQTFYENYVPLRGKEDIDFVMEQTGNGIEVRGPESMRALGRSSRAESLIAYTFQQHANALIRSERNKVMQALRKFAIENRNDEIKPGTPNYVRKLTKLTDGQQIVKMVNDPLWHRKHDVIALKVKGVNKYLRIKNPALAHELRNSGVSSIQEWTRGVGRMTRWLSKVNTQYNPSFIIPNLIRDIQFAKTNLSATQSKEFAKELANIWNFPGLFSRGKSDFLNKKQGVLWDAWKASMRYSNPKGLSEAELAKRKAARTPEEQATMDAWDAAFKEMREHGGRISFYGLNTFENQVDDLRSLAKQINKANSSKNSGKATKLTKQYLGKLKDMIEGVNGGMESTARLATYKLARDRGLSPQKAAYLSRNITVNFTRKGKYGSALNNLYMFFNANIQGSYNMYKALRHTEAGKKIFFNMLAAGFSLELLNQILSEEDDEGIPYYDKIPEWKKKTNFIIMNPFNGREAVSIPMPYGYNVVHYAGAKTAQTLKYQYIHALGYDEVLAAQEREIKRLGRQLNASEKEAIAKGVLPSAKAGIAVPGAMKPVEAAMNIMNTAANAFNPIGGAGTLLRMVTPDVADPLVDLSTNRDWKGDIIVPEPSPFAPYQSPDSERHWQTVGFMFEKPAKGINKLLGGSEVVSSGMFDVSPETLEHLMEHFTGGAGQSILGAANFVVKASTGEDWKANDIPVAKRFVSSPSSFYELEKFKDLREKSYQAVDLHKLYLKSGMREKANQHRKLNSMLFSIHPSVKSTEGIIRKINKAMRQISASRALEGDEKARRLRKLKQTKVEAMRRTHSKFIDIVDPV